MLKNWRVRALYSVYTTVVGKGEARNVSFERWQATRPQEEQARKEGRKEESDGQGFLEEDSRLLFVDISKFPFSFFLFIFWR